MPAALVWEMGRGVARLMIPCPELGSAAHAPRLINVAPFARLAHADGMVLTIG